MSEDLVTRIVDSEVVHTRERNQCQGNKCRDGISNVVPVDIDGISHHQAADKDQDRTSRPRRQVAENRREEDGDEEPEGRRNCRDTSLASLGNTGCGFYIAGG